MSDEDDNDKQYEPTQKRLDEARKKGEVPRSNDLTTAAGYGGFLITAAAFGSGSILALGGALRTFLEPTQHFPDVLLAPSGLTLLGGAILSVVAPTLPWFAIPAALALLSIVAQRGLVFAPTKLEPKFSRISPLSTFKQKFGRGGLFEFAKSFAKLLIFSVILGIYLSAQIDRIVGLIWRDPGQIAAELAQLTLGLLFIVLLVAMGIGVIDMMWQRAEHIRKHRMSRKEMTDEMKQSEGDPHFKQQRRQRGVEIAMNQMLQDVETADVIIVNPTHYAVALQWDPAGRAAPTCVAKGVDEVAAKIREVAHTSGVPIRSDPPTARALYATVEIGQEITSDLYRAVAAAIRFAEVMRKKVKVR